jgi:hypothetical protein
VLLWQVATLLAVAAAILVMGRAARPPWVPVLEAALALAWAALAAHANGRRKALWPPEMPPPEPLPGRGP